MLVSSCSLIALLSRWSHDPPFDHPVCLYSQLLSAVLLLLRLWESGTREMDNERSTQGTSAPLLPLLQRFQNIHSSKEEPVPEEESEVKMFSSLGAASVYLSNDSVKTKWMRNETICIFTVYNLKMDEWENQNTQTMFMKPCRIVWSFIIPVFP